MNRFFKKDKASPIEDNVAPKKTKKGKKVQEEDVKPDFDLSSALPKVDDFRTSLIMPGLSTRFSMLREQDDPNTKLGKACDDSVLQPKRQSRLHEFGFDNRGLSDIAEVSSLSSSVRPPLASDRFSSFDTNRSEDETGSIMTRARPGEGNVLFGGRQKIYMIPTNSTKGTGRTLYDDDVNMSAYQRLRMEEKEKLRQQQAEERNDHESEPSSPTALSQKRETSSSTNSGPLNARTSTAATSVASQGINSVPTSSSALPPATAPASTSEPSRSTSKVRRLYDQGLDQHIQDQQSSAINRLNSLQKDRSITGQSASPSLLSQTKPATSSNDRFQRGPAFPSDNSNSLGSSDRSINNSSAENSSAVLSSHSPPPPASPTASENEESAALRAALQPHDRGKATAMGAFNKPKEAFSEQQYAERLRQMQQERDVRAAPVPKEHSSPSRKPTLRERAEQEKRKRSGTMNSERQVSEASVEQNQPTAAFSVFQAAASQMRTTPTTSPSKPNILPQKDASQDQYTETTFVRSRELNKDDEVCRPVTSRPEAARRFENLPVAVGPAPPIFEHPALRSSNASEGRLSAANSTSHSRNVSPNSSPRLGASLKSGSVGLDSPTLGPNNGGLSGLIRQHLRNGSNVSSNSGECTTGPPAAAPLGLAIDSQGSNLQRRQPGSETATLAPSNHSHSSNPWDLDDLDSVYHDQRGSDSSGGLYDGNRVGQLTSKALGEMNSSDRERNTRRNHERIASNETEAEHEAFQRDLAYRQRLIQENLRARAEGRSTSPAPGSSGGLRTALNLLRAKSSHESFATVERQNEGPNKVMRKLALGANSANASSISLAISNAGDHWKSETPSLRPKQSRVLQQSEQDAQHGFERQSRSPPVSSRSSVRERSSSGTSSGRSRGRSAHRRDDLEHEDFRSTAQPPTMPGYVAYPPPPIPADRPSVEREGRMRSRSNSKPSAANQVSTKHLQPIQTSNMSGDVRLPVPSGNSQSKHSPISPRPSPGAYDSQHMNAYHSQTSPMAPFAGNPTPPTSNPATPNATVFNPSTVQPIRQVLRKKSIAKSDISEPVFVSTTSSMDLVYLPAGASLKNGAGPDAPPVPSINPMRKRFGFGRSETQSPPHDHPGADNARVPHTNSMRTNPSDMPASQVPPPKSRLRKASSEGRSLHGQAQGHAGPVPAMPTTGFVSRHNSPPYSTHDQPMAQRRMDGAMF